MNYRYWIYETETGRRLFSFDRKRWHANKLAAFHYARRRELLVPA